MEFQDAESQTPMDAAARKRKQRRTDPDFYTKKRKYQHDTSSWQTDAQYLSRPFVAWDGEGVTRADGSHDYVMLAVKAQSMEPREWGSVARMVPGPTGYSYDPHGLSTVQCFDMILDFAANVPGAIHVIYGGGYDFNMMMRDIPREDVEKIYRQKYHTWNGYRIGWRPGKSFYVARLDEHGRREFGVTIYDVVSFFQCPFVKACDDYLGDKFTNRDMIVANKAARGSFTDEDTETVRIYNDAELDNLLALVTELRLRLNRARLRPSRWDGPGAVAAALLKRERVKDGQSQTPDKVRRAARFAYAGGRFEVLKFGRYIGKVYEYDVNSAYPSALRKVPNLNGGTWTHRNGDPGHVEYALYRIEWHNAALDVPGPLFVRAPNGTISYPTQGEGWYWTPEYDVALVYAARHGLTLTVHEAYVFNDLAGERPFAFIDKLYTLRKKLKAAGDGAHVALKLGLNSLYGKLAQQIGAELRRDGTWKIPPFHQIEWAGYTTSYCRARVLMAVMDNLDSVIAFETDAVFTTVPLDVPVSGDLGDFELTEFDSLTYTQSGFYYATKSDGTEVARTRGVDRGYLTRESVEAALAAPAARDRQVSAPLTRFIGAGIALAQRWELWRRWETMTKTLSMEPTGKRVHAQCWCMTVSGLDRTKFPDGLHNTMCPVIAYTQSCEFPIVWENPNPDMTMLEELREMTEDYE